MNENRQYIQEDEIDLKELFNTLMKKKKFITVFTAIVTVLAIIWAVTRTPLYETRAFIEVGSIEKVVIENPNNLAQRLQIVYMNNVPEGQTTTIEKVAIVKKATNLIELATHSVSNEKAISKLNEIIDNINQVQQIKIDNYVSLIKKEMNNLKAQKIELENKDNQFEGSMAVKYELTTKLNALALQISSNNIKQTQIVGQIIKNDYPIKPKKKLIVVVAFITGFILSIFLVFFLEFIRSDEEESN